jgi:membrane associated rhomboid family serine protease
MGRPYWLMPSPEGYRLLVEPEALTQAREQLARFDRESVGWPPAPVADAATHATDVITPLLWALVILAVFHIQEERPEIARSGELDADAIFAHGEWWRVGTALFLHADTGHVVSNLAGGILVFIAVLKTFGTLRGWTLVAISSLIGNLAIAALHYPKPYRSLGASTALFAGVGLLTGRALGIQLRAEHPHRRRAMFVAVASGGIVLALYGSGGAEIDMGAHVSGFLAGVALGLFTAGLPWKRAHAQR